MSIFTALRAGLTPPVPDEDDPAPGAGAKPARTGEKETEMTEQEIQAALATARADGEKAGAGAERTRFAAIFGADGIKGDAAKMTAAIAMATQFPTATAEQVTGYVGTHVAGAAPTPPAPPSPPSGASLVERMKADQGAALPAASNDHAPGGTRLVSGMKKLLETKG